MTDELRNGAFNISIINQCPSITRHFEFKNGDTVTFTVTLDQDNNRTLPQTHRESIKALITHLQSIPTAE